MTVLVTGAAGFIGMHVAAALLARGEAVVGIDNLSTYYDVGLKQARLARLLPHRAFRFEHLDLADKEATLGLADRHEAIDRVIHLAAQPGVRHSLVDPYAYITTNVLGHLVVLELARRLPRLSHLVYASSSSVYGGNDRLPFEETDDVSRPVSLYAATKRADELMSETYRHLFGLPQTGLRFFTVYGPWGRPDMAVYAFARAILRGEPITLYDGGRLRRDFTYVDDIVDGVLGVLAHPPGATAPARILNVGHHRSESVSTLIGLLEASLGRDAVIDIVPRPATEVLETFASLDAIAALTGYAPKIELAEGVGRFVAWLRDYEALGAQPAAAAISA